MAIDTGTVDRALGAIGTTFRLTRLYPPSHPAVLEAMRHITAALPALAGLGSGEWKAGAAGLVWHGQHPGPRNTPVAELAALLFARGIRTIQGNPGVPSEPVLGLCVRSSIAKLRQVTPHVIALRGICAVVEVVAGLDRSLGKIQDPEIQEAIGEVAGALADEAIVERMVARLGEARVPPAERAHLVHAVGALGAVSAGHVVDAYLHALPELRESYLSAIRAAGERAVGVLQGRIGRKVPEGVAAGAEVLAVSGRPGGSESLVRLTREA